MRAYLEVPGILRAVSHYVIDIIPGADTHHSHKPLLEHVAEHLCVEAPGFVTSRYHSVDIVLPLHGKRIYRAKFGHPVEIVAAQSVAVIDID